jgi:hypothetical protein
VVGPSSAFEEGLEALSRLMIAAMAFVSWPIAASAERDEWNSFRACVELYVIDVASVVPSLEEGAALLRESLCVDEATALINAVASRSMLENVAVRDRFEAATAVVERETRLWLYETKRDVHR